MAWENDPFTAFDKEKMQEFIRYLKKEERIGRRLVHISSSLLVVYFLFPDIVFQIGAFSMHRALFLLILFMAIPFPMEFWRLHKGAMFYGQRSYERGNIAAYIWTLVGAITVCLLTEIGLPEFIAVPVMLSASLVDPFLGETRRIRGFRRRHIYSFAVMMSSLFYFIWLGNPVLAAITGFTTVVAESLNIKVNWGLRKEMLYDLEHRHIIFQKLKSMNPTDRLFYTDDNLMMQFIPLVFLTILYLTLPQLFPPDNFIVDGWRTDILSQYQFDTFFRI